MGDIDKSFTEVEINIHCSLLTRWASYLTVEGFQVSSAWISFCNSVPTNPKQPHVFHVKVSKMIYLITFQEMEVRLTSLYFCESSFLSILKIGVAFAFFCPQEPFLITFTFEK